MIENLLAEISAINQRYTLLNQKTGGCFNVFDIAGISNNEVVVCKLMCELLNTKGSHYQGDRFLRLFVRDVLKLDFTDMDYLTAVVQTEYPAERRRIDLMIISMNYMIPIEVKIHAPDLDTQCFDYSKTKQNSDLYYLTLDGRLPDKGSVDGLLPLMEDGDIIGYEGLKLLSFRDDIVSWISRCLTMPDVIKIAPIREILLQFNDVLLKLTGQPERGAKMEIANALVRNAENMISALEIGSALPAAKTLIMLNLFRELKRLFENDKRKTFDYDEEAINEYYLVRKPPVPTLSIEIKKLSGDIMAALCIEVEDGFLTYCFAFTEVKKSVDYCEFIETEHIEKEYPDLFKAFTDAVYDIMGNEKRCSGLSTWWDYILDDKGQKYDFKNFSPSCATLAPAYTEQIKKIHDKLTGYITSIAKKLG